jgi:hypothetical protein
LYRSSLRKNTISKILTGLLYTVGGTLVKKIFFSRTTGHNSVKLGTKKSSPVRIRVRIDPPHPLV